MNSVRGPSRSITMSRRRGGRRRRPSWRRSQTRPGPVSWRPSTNSPWPLCWPRKLQRTQNITGTSNVFFLPKGFWGIFSVLPRLNSVKQSKVLKCFIQENKIVDVSYDWTEEPLSIPSKFIVSFNWTKTLLQSQAQ